MRFSRSIAAIATLPLVTLVQAATPPPRAASWEALNEFNIRASSTGSTNRVSWRGLAAAGGRDLRIDMEQSSGGKSESGMLLLVAGDTLLAKGISLPAGAEIDVLDAPVLTLQLVTRLLATVLPGGPAGVRGTVKIDHVERESPISVGTASAGGSIPTPWYLRGSVTRAGGGRIDFDLQLFQGDALAASSSPALTYSGSLATSTRPPFLDSMSLAGWQAFALGPRTTQDGSAKILDYGATPTVSPAGTVAKLRTQIEARRRAEADPGRNDPSRDFSGFWKKRCDQDFGLRIQRGLRSEPYSVVFCGPGGCGDEEKGQKTFVTGDARWRVVGKDEIQERQGTEWSTYWRCAPPGAAGKP